MLAEDGGFWLCRASSDVWLDADTFSACWLEKEGESDLYKKQNWVVKLQLSSLLARVKMVREAGFLRIPQPETLRLELQLKKLKEGYKLLAYDKDHDQVSWWLQKCIESWLSSGAHRRHCCDGDGLRLEGRGDGRQKEKSCPSKM